jgi:uracil-DNA glycosylase family 4
MLDDRRARIWQAMGLGPRWVARATPATTEPVVAAISPPLQSGGPRAAEPQAPADARTRAIQAMDWSPLQQAVAACTSCGLCATRTQTVFGVGERSAHWMLVGEAPGAEEDARGEPFVGQAGRLLDNMLAAVGLARTGAPAHSVFIANVLKCRPPGNRNPEPTEVAACEPFLLRQVALVQPRVIVVMGRFAAHSLLKSDATIASLRGREHAIDVAGRRVPVVVTYHPAYLLRNLADKAKSWADLCLARDIYRRELAREAQ